MIDKQERRRVFLENFGCPSNTAEAESIAGCLSEAGFEVIETAEEADALIYNTCAVKTPTENRIIEILKKARARRDKKLVVTGCLPLINLERLKTEAHPDGILGPNCANQIVDAVRKVFDHQQVEWLDGKTEAKPYLDLPRHVVNPIVSIVPVATGCLGSCSYCCVVFARGHLRSYSVNEIVNRVRHDVGSGFKEVWLTGQDTACYGRDIGVKLPDLLEEICKISGEYWVRVGMMTPSFALGILPELTDAFQNEHVFKFVHLPVQSGDDEVLRRMNRFYSVEDFKRAVGAFRRAVPNITVATDVICGFPSETSEAFDRTLQLISDVRPDVINISKFFPRPKTKAEGMTLKVSSLEVTARSKKMATLVKKVSWEKNALWQNWTGRVLVDEYKKQHGSLIGRNSAYKPIVMKSEEKSLLGNFVTAHVTRIFQTYLEAEIIDSS